MTSVFGYLCILWGWIFWIVRTAICFCYSAGIETGIIQWNFTVEVVLLFVSLILLILVTKRHLWGAVVYLIINTIFYGKEIYFVISQDKLNILELFLSILGIIIPLSILFLILFGKDRAVEEKVDKKTDWFFNNKDYDREHDERADENQYKF